MMKWLIILLLLSFSSLFSSVAYAEDVFILHQSYGNTHQKWKNRLEDAGHTVTMGTSLPTDTTSYEQMFDIRYSNSNALTTSEKNAYKALLVRGGSLFLNGENPHSNHQTRNTGIASFVQTDLGGGTVTYSSS